jgi:hypothetical protein
MMPFETYKKILLLVYYNCLFAVVALQGRVDPRHLKIQRDKKRRPGAGYTRIIILEDVIIFFSQINLSRSCCSALNTRSNKTKQLVFIQLNSAVKIPLFGLIVCA